MEIPPGLDAMVLRAEARQNAEDVVCQRLLAWLCATPRQDAATAFTAGPLRDLAREIEHRLAAPRPRPPTAPRCTRSSSPSDRLGGGGGLERACTDDDWQMPEMVMTTPRRVS